MLSRLFGKVVFRVLDNHVSYCSLLDLDMKNHQPKPGSMVLVVERVEDGILVTEGKWEVLSQSLHQVVEQDLYDKESMRQGTSLASASACPYLMDEIDLWKVAPHMCEVTGNALDHLHARDRCKSNGWNLCPVYRTVVDDRDAG